MVPVVAAVVSVVLEVVLVVDTETALVVAVVMAAAAVVVVEAAVVVVISHSNCSPAHKFVHSGQRQWRLELPHHPKLEQQCEYWHSEGLPSTSG